jgi:hypothetical protein
MVAMYQTLNIQLLSTLKNEPQFHVELSLASQRRGLVYIDRAARLIPSLRFDVDDDDKNEFSDAAAYKAHFEERFSELKKSMARNGRLKQVGDGISGSFLKLFASAFSMVLLAFNDGSGGENLRDAGIHVRVKPCEATI